MRYILFLLLFVFYFQQSHSQASNGDLTFNFVGISKVEALERINSETDFQVYFLKEWFSDSPIQKSYVNKDLEFIVKDLLEGTTINHYLIPPDKVILTNSNLVYDQLPDGFFGRDDIKDDIVEQATAPSPVFYPTHDENGEKGIETIRIGRENRFQTKETHELSGYIRNLDSGEPIQNMAILTSQDLLLGVTGLDGHYSLELPPGPNILKFRALGIERADKRIIMFNDGTLDLTFNEGMVQLDEVIVEGGVHQNVEDVIAGTERVRSEESKTIPLVLGERDILKVATALPGISNAGEGATGFNV